MSGRTGHPAETWKRKNDMGVLELGRVPSAIYTVRWAEQLIRSCTERLGEVQGGPIQGQRRERDFGKVRASVTSGTTAPLQHPYDRRPRGERGRCVSTTHVGLAAHAILGFTELPLVSAHAFLLLRESHTGHRFLQTGGQENVVTAARGPGRVTSARQRGRPGRLAAGAVGARRQRPERASATRILRPGKVPFKNKGEIEKTSPET